MSIRKHTLVSFFHFTLTFLIYSEGFISIAVAQEMNFPDPFPDPLELIKGSWAENYNKCVEPFVVRVENKSIIFFNPQGLDSVETLIKIEGNKIYTKDLNDSSENVYEVEKEQVVSSSSSGHKTIVVRCWKEEKPFNITNTCHDAVKKHGSEKEFIEKIRYRFQEMGIFPYVNLESLSVENGCSFHFKFLDDPNSLLILSSIECEPLYLLRQEPLYRLPTDSTLSLNYEVLNNRRPHDGRFESCFEEKNAMSIWDKIMTIISNEFSIPMREIELKSQLNDCQYFQVWYARGSARFREFGCFSGISAKRPVLFPTPQVASAAFSELSSQGIDIDALEKTFIGLFLEFKGASVSVLEREDDHITFVVRGLRNQVIVGSNYWEKLTINVFIWRNFNTVYDGGDKVIRGFHSLSENEKQWKVKQSLQIRVITEGSYSGGTGNYPKDEFFTYNMEPEFHIQLTEFANYLAKKLSDRSQEVTP